MKFLIIVSCIALSKASSLGLVEVQPEPISPYSFAYTADAIGGGSSRQETADANGVVRGSYSLVSADGVKRIVNYIADENGFRAKVQTNEPGTESKSPADVDMESSQLPAEEIALKYGPRPVEQPEIQTFGIKGVEQKLVTPVLGLKTKNILLNRPLLTQHNVLTNFPNVIHKTVVEERPVLSHYQLTPKIETPIKLLSKIPQIHTLRPIGLGLQQKDDLVSQNFEQF